jgi:hypothetical protein
MPSRRSAPLDRADVREVTTGTLGNGRVFVRANSEPEPRSFGSS